MPRKPRELVEGGLYHVYARGNDRQVIFRDAKDRELYLSILHHVITSHEWDCIACCLMGNHLHLMIRTTHADLDAGMHLLHSLYARKYNIRHGHSGHLFQGRYGASRLTSDARVVAVTDYIEQNPVAAGLVERPEDWPWLRSSRLDR